MQLELFLAHFDKATIREFLVKILSFCRSGAIFQNFTSLDILLREEIK